MIVDDEEHREVYITVFYEWIGDVLAESISTSGLMTELDETELSRQVHEHIALDPDENQQDSGCILDRITNLVPEMWDETLSVGERRAAFAESDLYAELVDELIDDFDTSED